MARPSPDPAELRERAVRMVAEIPNHPTEWAAMKGDIAKLGVGAPETVRNWLTDGRRATTATRTTGQHSDRK